MTPTPTEIADSLLPCPFPHLGKELLHGSWPAKHQFWIHCPCGAMGPHADSPAKAIAAWNRRATSRGHRAAAEEIENAITAPLDLRGDKYLFGDEIMSLLKDRAEEVAAILARRFSASPKPELAKEFDALAEKATQGPMRSMREGNQYLDGLHSADGKSLVGASRVDGLARPWNRGGAALFIDMEHVSRFRDADADFIAWCFNHRTEISRALGGTVGDRYAEGYAAAREDAAKLAKGKIYKERYRQWPWYGEGNKSADSEVVVFADALATAIRAMKPQGGEE